MKIINYNSVWLPETKVENQGLDNQNKNKHWLLCQE